MVQLVEHNLQLRGFDPSKIIPGKIIPERFECVIPLEQNTAELWKDAISKMYNDPVTEKQGEEQQRERRNSVIERRKSMTDFLENSQRSSSLSGETINNNNPITDDFERLNNMYKETLRKGHEKITNNELDEKPTERKRSNLDLVQVVQSNFLDNLDIYPKNDNKT